MPTVPSDSSFNVAPQALPGVRVESDASAADFGGTQAKQAQDLGQATMSLGTDLSTIQANIQQRQNADQLFRAESSLKEAALQYHTDAMQRKGVNAWDLTKDTTKWWEDAATKYSEGLTNDAQRQAFGKTFAQMRMQGIATSATQEANERRASLEESGKASIVGSINMAAANYVTPGVVGDAVDDITKRTAVLSQLNGWTPERRDMETTLNLTSLHKQVIQNMVQEDPEQAGRYFDHYKDQIAGTDRDSVDKLIKGAKFTTAAQTFAAGVVASGASEGDAIAAARSKFAGPEQEQVVLEVKTRYQEKSKAREDDQRDAADTAFGIFARTGRLSAVPQSVRDRLDGRVLISLQHEAEAKVKGGALKTDPNAYYELRTLAATDPEAFAKRDLRGDFAKLDEGDREKFINLQQDVRKPAKVKDVVEVGSQLSDAHDLLGWKATDGAKKGAFDRAVTNQIDTAQTTAKRPLTFKERQEIIDRNMVTGKVDGAGIFGMGSSKPYYEVAGTPDASGFHPTPTSDEKDQIVKGLKQRGVLKPTDDQVLGAYKRWKGLP